MKLLLVSTLPALTLAYSMRGFDMFGRPITIHGVSSQQQACAPSSQRQAKQQQQQQQRRAVDQAFDDLLNDMNRMGDARTRFATTGPNVVSEQAIQRSKELVDRSFGFFSELNRDVARSTDEAERNEEMLRQQQKWANKVIDFAVDMSKDASTPSSMDETSGSSSDATSSDSIPKNDQETRDTTFVAPLYNLKDDAEVFQVELEVPGVNLADINIELEKETNVLTIQGERRSIGSLEPTKFSKQFMLDDKVETEAISAKLENGILVVTAPKKEVKKAETVKIPVA